MNASRSSRSMNLPAAVFENVASASLATFTRCRAGFSWGTVDLGYALARPIRTFKMGAVGILTGLPKSMKGRASSAIALGGGVGDLGSFGAIFSPPLSLDVPEEDELERDELDEDDLLREERGMSCVPVSLIPARERDGKSRTMASLLGDILTRPSGPRGRYYRTSATAGSPHLVRRDFSQASFLTRSKPERAIPTVSRNWPARPNRWGKTRPELARAAGADRTSSRRARQPHPSNVDREGGTTVPRPQPA